MSLAARGRRVVSRGRFAIANQLVAGAFFRTRSRITFRVKPSTKKNATPNQPGVALEPAVSAYGAAVVSAVVSDVPAAVVSVVVPAAVLSVMEPSMDVVSPVVVDVVSPV